MLATSTRILLYIIIAYALAQLAGCGDSKAILLLKKSNFYEEAKRCAGFNGSIKIFGSSMNCGESCLAVLIQKDFDGRKITMHQLVGVNLSSEMVKSSNEFYLVEDVKKTAKNGKTGLEQEYIQGVKYSEFCGK